MEGSNHSRSRRSSDFGVDSDHSMRKSPSYFKNVVSLVSGSGMSPLPSPRSPTQPFQEGKKEYRFRRSQSQETGSGDGATATTSAEDHLELSNIHQTNATATSERHSSQHEDFIPTASSPNKCFNPLAVGGGLTPTLSRRVGGATGVSSRAQKNRRRRRRRGARTSPPETESLGPESSSYETCGCLPSWCLGVSTCGGMFWCCKDRKKIVRSTLSCMNVVSRILAWSTVIASLAMVVWYSYELTKTRKDPHLILWNTAGAFVLIGFPISIYGIVMHLANYNQPETQVYIVRILFMVPIFSIQSWLGLRFKDYSIYFETIRDFYESFVLYSFLQFLIEVLGGEEALILMLKDKSPTRGVHIGGLQFCLKPWLMGQPVRKTYMNDEGETISSGGVGSAITASETAIPMGAQQLHPQQQPFLDRHPPAPRNKPLKRVYWTSPFFLKCKFGVLQYVLLKLASTIAILILEPYNLYKEGSFSPKGGYLYICILTNVSQTWALYCFFFFYFATKNELTPIRPVGKFLSVKLLVFFTWWQSLFIAILEQMQMIPNYISSETGLLNDIGISGANDPNAVLAEPDWSVPLTAEDAAALDFHGGKAFWPTAHNDASQIIEYSPEDVAKALQDWLICIEMFLFAIVHIFVFPHSEYAPEEVEARARALNQMPNKNWNKRLGRKWKEYDNKSAWSGTTNTSRESADIELYPLNNHHYFNNSSKSTSNSLQNTHKQRRDSLDEDDLRVHPMDKLDEEEMEHHPLLLEEGENDEVDDDSFGEDEDSSFLEDVDEEDDFSNFGDENDEDVECVPPLGPRRPVVRKKNFFSALLDSTIPQDLRDNTVGIIKGEYVVERKTLLHHAATSDSYDLLSRINRHNKDERDKK